MSSPARIWGTTWLGETKLMLWQPWLCRLEHHPGQVLRLHLVAMAQLADLGVLAELAAAGCTRRKRSCPSRRCPPGDPLRQSGGQRWRRWPARRCGSPRPRRSPGGSRRTRGRRCHRLPGGRRPLPPGASSSPERKQLQIGRLKALSHAPPTSSPAPSWSGSSDPGT